MSEHADAIKRPSGAPLTRSNDSSAPVTPPKPEASPAARPEPSVAVKRQALFKHLRERHGLRGDEVSLGWYGLTFNEGQAKHLEIRPHTHTDGKD